MEPNRDGVTPGPCAPDAYVPDAYVPEVERLRAEVAARAAEVAELRRALHVFYRRVARWSEQIQTRLDGIQEQVEARTAPPVPSTAPPASSLLERAVDRHAAYRALVGRLRAVVERVVPEGATLLVVSKGDDALLKLGRRTGWHFPRRDDGVYAGHYPADGAAAVRHLEELRGRGADYLVLPGTGLWWLRHYGEFARHLDGRYEWIYREDETCWIARLRAPSTAGAAAASPPGPAERAYREMLRHVGEIVALLLPADAVVLVVSRGDEALRACGGAGARHFPQAPGGAYAGHHPADSREAVAHLEQLRRHGAEYLLVPQTAFWWLDHYTGFREHLERRYRLVCRQQHACLIYALRAETPTARAGVSPLPTT